jgi:predicted AAA+ superfamily ATPase
MEIMKKQNPWWEDKEDYHVKKWEGMKVRWIPRWIKEVSLTPFSLNFVFGPRQTGKTTGIKLLIRDLLKKVEKEAVFYFDVTLLADIDSLKKVLDKYLEIKRVEKIKGSFIFLDEVTTLDNWWKIIKGYIDMGIFQDDVLTVTGSSSLKLKGQVELFPGRRGKGKDITVLPLSFKEFLDVHGMRISTTGDVEKDMKKAWKEEERIKELFKMFLAKGGYPVSINEDPTAESQLISAIENEILMSGKSLELMKGVISSIFKKAPSPLSFSTIGNEIGISYKTVQEYAEVARRLFIFDSAYYKEKNINWRKERKFFFLDPFLAKTLSIWCGDKFLDSALYEWIVQSHLLRKFGSVYYYRNSFEIDCIADSLKIEVKAGKPHRKYPRDVIILDEDSLPIFLAVI